MDGNRVGFRLIAFGAGSATGLALSACLSAGSLTMWLSFAAAVAAQVIGVSMMWAAEDAP